jgi:hypothetical protein
MIHTIGIVKEKENQQKTIYRAVRGNRQASGQTAGQALDNLEQILSTSNMPEEESTLVILQRFQPDSFFTAEQQKRLRELTDRFNDARNRGQSLPSEEQLELEKLVEAEWEAAIKRASEIMSQTSRKP